MFSMIVRSFFGHWLLFSLLCGWPALAVAGEATLSWNPNNESDLMGYNIYYGTSSGNYTAKVDVGNVLIRTITGLTEGATYYFALTAYDMSGNESGFSSEASIVIASVGGAGGGGGGGGGGGIGGGAVRGGGGCGLIRTAPGRMDAGMNRTPWDLAALAVTLTLAGVRSLSKRRRAA
jgi:hypothetical protein